jgi:hypothetical protein
MITGTNGNMVKSSRSAGVAPHEFIGFEYYLPDVPRKVIPEYLCVVASQS